MFAQTILIGRLGKDPETRSMPSGKAVTNFSVATSERWKDKQSGEKKEQTEWHTCAAFDRTAEIAAEFLHKGDLVHVVGRPRTDKVENRDGTTSYYHKIIVDKLTLMPQGSRDGGQREERDDDREAGGAEDAGQSPAQAESFDDDIPF